MEQINETLSNEIESDSLNEGAKLTEDLIESEIKEDWQPEYKFRVLDKEHEFDDFIRPIVTKDNYEKVKELYEKAYGLDHVKNKYQATREEFESFKNSQYQPLLEESNQYKSAMQYMGSLIKSGDYDNLFRELNIPEEALLNYSIGRINYRDLSPEQRLEYDRNVEARQKNYTLEMQNQQLQSQFEQMQVKDLQIELSQALMNPQIKPVIEEYEQQRQQPGAFMRDVAMVGKYVWETEGKHLSVQDAIGRVIQQHNQTKQWYGSGTAAPQNNVETQVQTSAKATIPQIKSTGNSPIKKRPTSIEDLKRLADSMNN